MWILIILIVIVFIFILLYNKMVRLNLRCDNAWASIDNQLKRRADLIPNLVEITKGYAKHESETLLECINARNNTINQTAKTSDEITKNLRKLFALQESYPDLKANLVFKNLQIELVGTEDKIAFARQFYNDCVQYYNTAIEMFPTNLFAKMLDYKKRQFFTIKEVDKNPIKVEL